MAPFILGLMVLWAIPAGADIEGPPARFPATVTAKMGDVGGKFFGKIPDPARTRHYYIAAETALWDYAPEGRDVVCGKPFPPGLAQKREGMKTRYAQYTDATFQTRVRSNPGLGILGPILRGQIGDYLAVTFYNHTLAPLSMHPHGVKYDKDSEGSFYQPNPGLGGAVGIGAKFTYVWQLDEASGPLPGEPSSKGWLYHSHVDGDAETQRGLIGGIIVTDSRRARPDGSPSDVDREFATLYMIFDESGLVPQEIEAPDYEPPPKPSTNAPGVDWAKTQEQMQLGSRYTINGLTFGNLPGLEMNEGERVRWYVFALGSETDFHTAHWHGLRVVEDGRRRTDVVELLPATMKVADMIADNPGSWLMHCHVAEHMLEGMFARVVVHPRQNPRAPKATFLGVGEAVNSLQITRADARAGAGGNYELKLEGNVTVAAPFAAPETAIVLQAAGATFTFKLDQKGRATQSGNSFAVKNANAAGMVTSGLMEFAATLSGPELSAALKNGTQAESGNSTAMTIGLQIDSVPNSAQVRINWIH